MRLALCELPKQPNKPLGHIKMEHICKKSQNYKEAEEWDIKQQLSMTPEERQAAAKELRERVYGPNPKDVKDQKRQK